MDRESLFQALARNHLTPVWAETKQDALELIKNRLWPGALVGMGNAVTLHETGIVDLLKSGDYDFIDTQIAVANDDELIPLYRQAFFADVYLSSAAAITEDGLIYNVDCRSNRVAALLFGPTNVIIVAGRNKIVANLDEAIERNRQIAAPKNASRLGRATPCAKTGVCLDCRSPQRICSNYVVMGPQTRFPKRVTVILVNEDLGY